MDQRICYLCGQPAKGFASVWTAEHGERWYCHGDEDCESTCYERAAQIPSLTEEQAASLMHAEDVPIFNVDSDFTSLR